MPYNSNKETSSLLLLLISYIALVSIGTSKRLSLIGRKSLYLKIIEYKIYILARRQYISYLRSTPI